MADGTIHAPIVVGQRFGILTIEGAAELRQIPKNGNRWLWPCRCDCGALRHIEAKFLRNGAVRSCGCRGRTPNDLVGAVFGRLTVLRLGEPYVRKDNGAHRRRWMCRCECGNEKLAMERSLVSGDCRSCGCLARDLSSERNSIHGMLRTPEYNVWRLMRQRCMDPNNTGYANYGGRGITVCDRWLNGEGGKPGFECFLADMGARPSPKHSIERADVNGPYAPWNCRWATLIEQANNRRNNRYVEHQGKRITISEAARRVGLNEGTVRARIKKGWPEAKWLIPALR